VEKYSGQKEVCKLNIMKIYTLLKEAGPQNLMVLLKRLFVVFFIYQLSRILFYSYNLHHFSDVSFSELLYMMWGGLRFDTTAIIYLNSLFILGAVIPLKIRETKNFQKVLGIIFVSTNAIGYAFNILDIFYFDYILKRSTVALFMFAKEGNMGVLFWQFLKDFWMGFIGWGLFVYATYRFFKITKVKTSSPALKSSSFYSIGSLIFLLVAYFSIIGVRGGFTRTTRPIAMNNAGRYVKNPLEMSIVLNTPFSIIRTIGKKTFKPKKYYSEEELNTIYSPVKHFESAQEFTAKNVVIIIVESLAKEYIGSLNKTAKNGKYKGYTPFIDSLIKKSHTYTNAYANGRKSIAALPSVVASIPSLVQPFILSPYATNKINGIGTLLQEKGYQTAFFHGAPNGSMGFDAFMNMAGHKQYFGYDEYNNPDDFDGNWGIWDEKFLTFTARKLTTFQQPFLASIFTLSSHHPFNIPKEYKDKFKEGELAIHKPIQYLDYSLQQFFKTASKMPWYENTIFVITADHCNQSILPDYQSSIGAFAIPIIIFQPTEMAAAKMDDTITEQADILPKILRALHYSGDFISFGYDSQNDSTPFAVNFINQTWQFLDNDYLLQFRAEKSVGLYAYKSDKKLKDNLILKEKEITIKLERLLKAYIQQYNNRLIDNKMVIKK